VEPPTSRSDTYHYGALHQEVHQAPPTGHERYLTELAGLIARPGPPDQAEITALRARHDIEQLTPLIPGRLR